MFYIVVGITVRLNFLILHKIANKYGWCTHKCDHNRKVTKTFTFWLQFVIAADRDLKLLKQYAVLMIYTCVGS